MLYIFKIVSVLTFVKIVLLILPITCKNFANLFISVTKINTLFCTGAQVAVYSEINTKHIKTVWTECTVV